MTDRAPEPIESVLPRALGALQALAELGESIEDEWQYVNDLLRIHTADLQALADGRRTAGRRRRRSRRSICWPTRPSRITDPHRAIDWLSTLPQAVRLALELRA